MFPPNASNLKHSRKNVEIRLCSDGHPLFGNRLIKRKRLRKECKRRRSICELNRIARTILYVANNRRTKRSKSNANLVRTPRLWFHLNKNETISLSQHTIRCFGVQRAWHFAIVRRYPVRLLILHNPLLDRAA